ncbi:MAG: DUF2089 domain-containing protein [Clostridiaceae bacterium]|jgi:hypothetical protein|nr:DUF2089 domain-containing protein [Clostridiaceae bacterium]
MKKEALGRCPVCGQDTEVTAIYCGSCDTKIEGHFSLCRFCRLTAEQKAFIETFIKCRGNIKEVEKELGISYPTVKSRLEDAANALGYGMQSYESPENARRMEILDMLDSGLITVEEAIELLK